MFTQSILPWLATSLFSVLSMIFRGIGVPGVVVLVAGGLLVMGLSSALKQWIKTPRGILVVGIVLIAAMGFAWFNAKTGWAAGRQGGGLARQAAAEKAIAAKKAKADPEKAKAAYLRSEQNKNFLAASAGAMPLISGGGMPIMAPGLPVPVPVGRPGVAFVPPASVHGQAGGHPHQATATIEASPRPAGMMPGIPLGAMALAGGAGPEADSPDAQDSQPNTTTVPAAILPAGQSKGATGGTAVGKPQAPQTSASPASQAQQPSSADPTKGAQAPTNQAKGPAAHQQPSTDKPQGAQPSSDQTKGQKPQAQPKSPGKAADTKPKQIYGNVGAYRARHSDQGSQGAGPPGQRPSPPQRQTGPSRHARAEMPRAAGSGRAMQPGMNPGQMSNRMNMGPMSNGMGRGQMYPQYGPGPMHPGHPMHPGYGPHPGMGSGPMMPHGMGGMGMPHHSGHGGGFR